MWFVIQTTHLAVRKTVTTKAHNANNLQQCTESQQLNFPESYQFVIKCL